ncbi:hypothetical protein BsWGS_07044 [Bradybaena similaris]
MFPQIGMLVVSLCLTQAAQDSALTFTSYRQLGKKYCALFECTVVPDGRISRVLEVSIYNVTTPNAPIKIAYVTTFEPVVYIEQCNIRVVNGTGSVSGNQGQLALSLQDADDCLHARFECRLEYLYDYPYYQGYQRASDTGVIRVDPVPRDYCSSASAEYRINELQVYVDELIAGVNRNLRELQDEIADLRIIVDGFNKWLPLIEAQIRAYYQSLKQVNCIRGGNYSTSKQLFLLWGYVPAVCDTVNDGGGWVFIQSRTNDSVDFYRPWEDYKNGFGSTGTNFWIGLENIYNLTQSGYNELRFDFGIAGTQYYAQYSNFSVGDESSGYVLAVSGYSGTAGDSLGYHNGQNFTTYDRDDAYACSANWRGGWWYNYPGGSNCAFSNLNGPWGSLAWNTLTSNVWTSEIKVRKGPAGAN